MGCWWEATNLGFHQPTVVIVSDGGDFERWLGHLPERLELDGVTYRVREQNVSGGQASKSTRRMPWLQEAMKDVVKLR